MQQPRFAHFDCLYEPASISDCIPEDKNPADQDVLHKAIEDVLAVPAVVESASDLTAIVDDINIGLNDDHDSKEEGVDIMTIAADTHRETPTEANDEENSCPESRSDKAQQLATSISTEQEIIPSSSEFQTNKVDFVFPEAEATLVPLTIANSLQPQPQLDQEKQNGDDDLESLISYSEADDTTISSNVSERTPDMQVPSRESVQDVRDIVIWNKINAKEMLRRSIKNATPNDTIDDNENGQSVVSEIRLFKDTDVEDDLGSYNETKGLCLNDIEQAHITSPPKRQISFNQNDNVTTTPTSA